MDISEIIERALEEHYSALVDPADWAADDAAAAVLKALDEAGYAIVPEKEQGGT